MRRVCVFLGSNPGHDPAYRQTATALGAELAARGLGLVYGGSGVGLMGALARSVLDHGGQVTGIIPESLKAREVAFEGLRDLRVVGSMHQRKALMAELADGFIAMPGGLGTLEEFVEVLTWAQLGMHKKPCALLNTAGIFDGLLDLLDYLVGQGFVAQPHRDMILVHEQPAALLDMMRDYTPPTLDKTAMALRLDQS
ncbi:MAG: TIGR00730 family Rossman fold protein [Deltaproteobacteria bacterium]|nr:TIGR00730 family Rossman fold protein [Deltaproteobacteria bacterium]